MKSAAPLFLLTPLLPIAASHPPRRDHHHPHARLHKPPTAVQARDLTVVVAGLPSPTQVTEVVVFVDGNGHPVRTATEVVVLVPPSTSHAPPTITTVTVTASGSQQPTGPVSIVPIQVSKSTTGTAASTAASAGSSSPSSYPGSGLLGISYSPYYSDGSCKPGSRVLADMQQIAAQNYGLVRIYGVDCRQVATVVAAAKSAGLKLFLGIYDIDSRLGEQVQELVNAVYAYSGDWSVVEAVSVGNELVNSGRATAQQVVAAVAATRQALRGAGFAGPVVTVDTFVAVLRHPSLCDGSDFCALNIHPFFDPYTPAAAAGKFVADQVAAVRNALENPNQRIVVTETGWPWQGCANGKAVPGKDNQRAAIASIKTVFSGLNVGGHAASDLILFSAFNDLWKQAEASTFYAEQYWGISQF